MSIFIIALLLGAGIHQIVSLIQPRDERSEYQIGRRVVIRFEAGSYVKWKAGTAIVLGLLIFIVVIIINVQGVHPSSGYPYQFADSLTSPGMAAAVFGFLVGLLVGNLMNRLLKKGYDYQFSSSDRLEVVLIFALTILGMGGEEILRSAAQRINKVSVGTTTEISFADVSPKSSRLSAEQPKGAFRNTQGKGGGSAGLSKLFDLGSKDKPNLDRDKDFIQVLGRYEREPSTDLIDTGRFAKDVLSPIASCLMGITRFYGDDAFVDTQLTGIAKAMRDLAGDAGPAKLDDIRNALKIPIGEIADYVRLREADFKSREPIDDSNACTQLRDTKFNTAPALENTSLTIFRDSKDVLPYVAIAVASVMAAQHHYEAATITMDRWIRKHVAPKNVAERWYLLRAESTQAQFMEEWIRDRGEAASSAMRKYHIDNLRAVVTGMRSFDGIAQLAQKNKDYKLSVGLLGAFQSGDDGTCKPPALPPIVPRDPPKPEPDNLKPVDATERLETIYNSYLSARKDFVDHSLKHPTIKVKSASLIESEILDLMTLSLRCQKAGQAVTRAEHIERFVRSELNLLDNTSGLKSSTEVSGKVREIRQKLAFAFQLIDTDVKSALKRNDEGPIEDRLQTDHVLEVYETLLATQDLVQSFSAREVAN